jgi:hypothetical protein
MELKGIDQSGDYYYDKWIGFVRDALSCLDLKTLTWAHLPNDGGYYDQDEFFMNIWETVKHIYTSLIKGNRDG